MKYLFVILILVMVTLSIITVSQAPESSTDKPVIYWVTDPNPARIQQIEIFQRWLKKDPSRPDCVLKLDTANNDKTKVVIQAVSNVGGDCIDTSSGAGMRFFHSVGFIRDITDEAEKLGFDVSKTYPAMEPEITIDGRQYMYPCNVAAVLYWVNKDTFEQAGMSTPPQQWTLEEFEKFGVEYIKNANTPGQRQTHFFCDGVDQRVLRRSVGLSDYNETMTRCILDDPRNVEILELVNHWIYDVNIIPTPAQQSSFSTDTGYGGAALQLFNSGNYAMFRMGRYALIQLREFGNLRLAVSQQPHGGYPNTTTSTRAISIYKNSPYPDIVPYFPAYLASEEYNMQIVRDADALPPNPIYTKTQAYYRPLPLIPDLKELFDYTDDETHLITDFMLDFYAITDVLDRDAMLQAQQQDRLREFIVNATQSVTIPRPAAMDETEYLQKVEQFYDLYVGLVPQYQNEWGCHEIFSDAMENIAIAHVNSPFLQTTVKDRLITSETESYNAGIQNAQEAAQKMTERINEEMKRTVEEKESLQTLYDELTQTQIKIDELRQQGKKVPLSWITNPFYRRYYAAQGWADEEK